MRKLLPILLAFSVSVPAAAKGKDKAKVRVKVDTGIAGMTTATAEGDDNDADISVEYKTKTSGFHLGNTPARIYGGYIVAPNVEIGAAVEVGQQSSTWESDVNVGGNSTTDDGDGDKTSQFGLLASVAYNQKLGDSLGLFVQGKGGIRNEKTEFDSGDDAALKGVMFGAEAGLRVLVNKKAGIDFGLEYLMGNANPEWNGDNEDGCLATVGLKDCKLKASELGLRAGAHVKF